MQPTFVGGLGGQVGGMGIAPGVPGNAVDATASANRLPSPAMVHLVRIAPDAPVCPLAVSLSTFPSDTLKTPLCYQYGLGLEQQIATHGDLHVDFVGTSGLHEPYQTQLNGYQNVCLGCLAPYRYVRPLDQRFGSVNEFRTDANSSYAGLQTSYTQQIGTLTLGGNYTLSHCLDEVSNGGLLSFSTQGVLSPLPVVCRVCRPIAGRLIPGSRLPAPNSGSIPKPLFQPSIPPRVPARAGDCVTHCQFGDCGRNTVRGPHFTSSDVYLTKNIRLREGVTFRFDAQHFNAFNHPNFALPSTVQAGVRRIYPGKVGNPAKYRFAPHGPLTACDRPSGQISRPEMVIPQSAEDRIALCCIQ